MFKQFETMIGDRKLVVETGKYAEQAGGSCLVRCGGTAVLVCATVAKAPRDGVDFLPLSIEFEEKLYSVGKIPGGFIKREGRPSEIIEPSVTQLRSLLTNRQQFRRTMGISETNALQRTLVTIIAQHRRTLQRPELHDSGVEQPWMLTV